MSTLEDRLRTAVQTEADRIVPDEAGSLGTIRTRGRAARRRRRAIGGSVMALVVAALVALVPRAADRNHDVDVIGGPDRSTTTTSAPATTRTTPATTATTTPTTTEAPPTSPVTEPGPDETVSETPTAPATPVLWPSPDHEPLTDPVEAARSFTQEMIGAADPVLSAFRPGATADEGQVDVHARGEDGQPLSQVASTVSLLRHEGRWYVTSASSADVVVDTPQREAQLVSPVTVLGVGRGFEGTIVVEVRTAFSPGGQALGRATAIAGAGAQPEPFSVEVSFSAPPGTPGALVATNDTGLTNGTVSFTAFPLTLI